jgi:hypothetical protein
VCVCVCACLYVCLINLTAGCFESVVGPQETRLPHFPYRCTTPCVSWSTVVTKTLIYSHFRFSYRRLAVLIDLFLTFPVTFPCVKGFHYTTLFNLIVSAGGLWAGLLLQVSCVLNVKPLILKQLSACFTLNQTVMTIRPPVAVRPVHLRQHR